jgi:outer membrane protein OmpA-like peptidoglycan-associated protein
MNPTRQFSLVTQPAPLALAGSRYPFVPFGLVPLVGLLVLMIVALVPFAFGEVESVAGSAARKALDKAGIHWVETSVSGQWVVLEGKPPSRAEAAEAIALVKAARADTLFGSAQPVTWVIDHFTWTEDPLRPGDIIRTPLPGEPLLAADPAAAACDESMAALLSGARIEFATASADMGRSSGTLLDSIARAASACEGVLRVEGHTDGVGADSRNQPLSLRRAEAVRAALIARGVAADRLIAEGFGDSRPIATNNTAAGRARNRRIEIRSVRSPHT